MANRIQVRRDTAANWTTANPVLAAGEPALETDTGRRKTGDGTAAWTALPYVFDKTIADGIYTTPAAADAAYAPITGSANYVAPGQLDAANAANITTPTSATAGALNAAYATLAKQRYSTMLARIGGVQEPIPPVSTDLPTVTHGTVDTVTGAVTSPQSPNITKLSAGGNWNSTFARLDVNGNPGLGFYFTGTDVEINWNNSAGTTATPRWIFVDGQPVTADPDTTANLTAGVDMRTRLSWTTKKRRKIQFYIGTNTAWRWINTAVTDSLEPLPPQLRISFVGDSFFAGGAFTPSLETIATYAGRALSSNFQVASVGGTGYSKSAPNNFGGAARVALVQSFNPELIVISGSCNDDGQATVGADSAAAYAAYATACPGVPIIVFGPQPTNAVDSVASARATVIAAVKASALAAPNVIAFYDMLGSTPTTAAWSSSTSYSSGDIVSYNGAIWTYSNGTVTGLTSTPGTAGGNRWKLTSWLYTGTGNSGAPNGTGSRDILLYTDGVHPTTPAHYLLGLRHAALVIDALKTKAAS